MFLISSLTLHVHLSRRWAFFYQCLTNINIAVQQLDGVGREVKLWSHVGVVITWAWRPASGAWTFANCSNREITKTPNRRERGSLWTWMNGCERERSSKR